MDANEWKRSVTGGHCPSWCVCRHDDEDPEIDSIVHESKPSTMQLPPLVNGTVYTVSLSPSASENFQDQQRSTQLDLAVIDDGGRGQLGDYVPVTSRHQADALADGLEAMAAQIRAWRDLLPD
ncbi:hypothetical protein [Streptomyces sp. YIM 121038]|uniref:DUF6907 domain-containing protein n=1 Tax=Streptomyces sp. YIM 121038 TaxID=2136401 RepID=UPI001110452D|nr:hypothetical protein [Streptomyces sp. YIM 121038]